jgi:probable HAF family extracellular repeat protein
MPAWRLPLALGLGLALACRPDQLPTDPSTVQRLPSFAAAVLPSGTIHLLPGLGGSFGSQALALSPTGDIVGYASTPSGFFNAVLWQGGAAIDLGGGPLTPFRASGINAAGQIIGTGVTVSFRAIRWQIGAWVDLGSPAPANTEAFGINALGHVVGRFQAVGQTGDRAAIWRDGIMTDLGVFLGQQTVANAVNVHDVVVGQYGDGGPRPFKWEDGTFSALPVPAGAEGGAATAINDDGVIVGWYWGADFVQHAVVWEDGVIRELPPLGGNYSAATGVNNLGQIVGSSMAPGNTVHATLWQDGLAVDLGSLSNQSSARAINDAGVVVGTSAIPGSLYDVAVFWTLAVSPGATPVGNNVEVAPVEPHSGSSPATLTFSAVTSPGTTTIAASGTGAPPPQGYKLGNPPVYYELTTTATYTGSITVCFSYDAAAYQNPSNLKLFHGVAGVWTDVTTSHDQASHTICGTTTSLSPYILAELLYDFTGFFQPVDNGPVLNQVKAGSSIPVKFSLGGALGLDVLATNSPTTGIVSCGAVPTIDAIEEVTTSTSGLHYENGQYIYVWKTQPAWKGTCRKFMLNLKDGTQHIALFQFK